MALFLITLLFKLAILGFRGRSATYPYGISLYQLRFGPSFTGPGGCIAKCPFAEKTYAGICRPVTPHCAKACISSKVCAPRIARGFGYKQNDDPGAVGCYEQQMSCVHCFPVYCM